MKSKCSLALLLLVLALSNNEALAQIYSWTQTSAPSNNWQYVASTSDASKLVAEQNNGYIYISTNYGATWTQTGAPSNNWSSVTSSSDGNNLVAANGAYNQASSIFTSTNYGATWTRQTNLPSINNFGVWVASSSAGSNLVAVQNYIYTSADYGRTWIQHTNPSSSAINWFGVASSSDGSKLLAADHLAGYNFGYIYTSADFGVTWTLRSNYVGGSPEGWQSVASSSDGSTLVAVANSSYGGFMIISTNYGASWEQRAFGLPKLPDNWMSVASSSDGSKLVAASFHSIYTSRDYGVTWIQQTNAPQAIWNSVTISSDGNRLVGVQTGGYIYTAFYVGQFSCSGGMTNGNYGFNLQFNGTPDVPYVLESATSLNAPINWRPVATNFADINGNWTFTETNVAAILARFFRATVQ